MSPLHGRRKRSPLQLVLEFYEAVGNPVRSSPTGQIPPAEVDLILRLLSEESNELRRGIADEDVVGIADALADIAYVIYGAALQFGIDLDRALEEVHAANMSKPNSDGTVVRARDGKVLRGDSYKPPALRDALGLDDPVDDDAL